MVQPLRLGRPRAEEGFAWGELRIHAAYYVTDVAPPEELVSSVRAVVRCSDEVLVCRNPDAVHALPGGRREPGESFEQTLRRELLEETGFEIQAPRPLGLARLRPEGRSEFLWAVYVAESDGRRVAEPDDDYEEEARFVPADEALALVDLPSRVYVEAALSDAG